MAHHHYAGIGSRETPSDILSLMTSIATALEARDFILRSGHAGGADLAFEAGVCDPQMKEIFLPWRGFNGSTSQLFTPPPGALELAASYHPAWDRCSDAAKKLHARNCGQILGWDLATPVNFVICWTKDGGFTGGTGQALRIADDKHIPIFNLHSKADRNRISKIL